MRALRQFWSQGTSSKIVVLATAGVIVLIGLFGVLLIGNSLQGGNTETNSQATRGALAGNSTPTATHGSNASPASTSAGTAAAGTPTTASGGPPQLGAPVADFVTAYGQPTQQPNVQQSTSTTDDFWGNTQQTVLIDTTFTNGLATNITVVGPPASTSSQTFEACAVFLPPDATSYSSAPPDTYYHSSVGNLVLENDDSGLCKVFVTSS